jgi:dipeptidyl aminopeptidase/acylaminoacyl peptidase
VKLSFWPGRSRLPLLGALVVLPVAMPAAAQTAPVREPITHESMWMMKRVGSPVPSPDGRWVVFAVSEPSYDPQRQVSDLWIVAADGGAEPRRLTATRGGESGVAWSPDGRRIAFSARREGDDAAQIYVLDVVGGGEAQRITSVSTGARAPQWSPDGRSILFAGSVLPGAVDDTANVRIAGERRAQRHRARVYDGFPIRNWDRWLDDSRQTLLVQEAVAGARPRNLLSGTRLAAGVGFGGSMGSGSEQIDAAWTPDGRGVVFAATVDRHTAAHAQTSMALYHLSLDGGEPRRITPEGASFGNPRFAPDGRRLFATMSPRSDWVFNNTRIAAFSWPNPGEPTVITADIDRSISDFVISGDGRTLYFTAEDRGHDRVFAVAATGGRERAVTPGSTGGYGGLSLAGRGATPLLVATWESAVNPPEVVRIDARTGRHQRLSSFNVAAAERIDWEPVEHFWFTSSRGAEIHNMLVRPAGFDPNRRYPLLVLMHGGPHIAWKDQYVIRWNYHLLAQPGYVVLLTNYTGSTGFGEAFARGIQHDPLAGPAQEINEAADEAIRRFAFIDGTRQAAGGASYGGHLAYWMQGVTDRYRTLVAHAGAMNMESQWGTSDVIFHREINFGGPVWEQGPVWREQNPIRRAAEFRTPMLLTVGEQDFRVPLNTTLEAWSVLQRLQIPSRLIVFPEETTGSSTRRTAASSTARSTTGWRGTSGTERDRRGAGKQEPGERSRQPERRCPGAGRRPTKGPPPGSGFPLSPCTGRTRRRPP